MGVILDFYIIHTVTSAEETAGQVDLEYPNNQWKKERLIKIINLHAASNNRFLEVGLSYFHDNIELHSWLIGGVGSIEKICNITVRTKGFLARFSYPKAGDLVEFIGQYEVVKE